MVSLGFFDGEVGSCDCNIITSSVIKEYCS